MIQIPSFIRSCIRKATCPHCNCRHLIRGVQALGVRTWKESLIPSVEFACPRCGSELLLVITDRPTTVQQFGALLWRIPPDRRNEAKACSIALSSSSPVARIHRARDRSPQVISPITILDCVPGNFGSENGRPITLINYECDGDIELPLALTIEDTRRLVPALLLSLTEAGDDLARILLDMYWPDG